jgi:predicted DNA binding CopG/RHH family protein
MEKYIDQEEEELIESLHSGEWDTNINIDKNNIYKDYAINSIELNNKIEINLTEKDIQKIKIKAIQQGTTYQALISMLVHNYNEGKIALNL